MIREQFEKLIEEEFPNAVPEQFRGLIKNLAFIAEDEPSVEVRKEERLRENETLLGYYRGIPHTARGDLYGIGATLPDTIVLYQFPIEDEAEHLLEQKRHSNILKNVRMSYEECVRRVIRETIWHEVAHFFGMDEHTVRKREDERDTI